MIVVADTSPLNYLVIIGYDHLLPKLFGAILVPPAVFEELNHPDAPERVRRWIDALPEWVHIQAAIGIVLPIENLGKGETEGIALAVELRADLILIDDSDARQEAAKRNLTVTGTLGVLRLAALQRIVDLPEAIAKLRSSNFFVSPRLVDDLLAEVKQHTSDGDR
jgi:predicted nucleic acid-binding protein